MPIHQPAESASSISGKIQEDALFRTFFRIPAIAADSSRNPAVANSNSSNADLGNTTTPSSSTFTSATTLDRLSLLACERQGIRPLDDVLQATPAEGGRAKNVPQLVQEARLEANHARRKEIVRLLEMERKRIVHVLHAVHRSLYDDACSPALVGGRRGSSSSSAFPAARPTHHTLSLEQQVLVGELAAQADAHARSANRRLFRMAFLVTEERAIAVPLLAKQSSASGDAQDVAASAIRRIQEEGARDLEKLQQRELRAVEREIDVELVKSEMLSALQKREADLLDAKLRRKEEAAQKAEREDQLRQQKIDHIHEQHAKLMRERAAELEHRGQMRDAHMREVERKKEAETEARRLAEEKAQEEARERARLLAEDREAQRMLLETEVRARMNLQTQRKQNIDVKLSTVREMRSLEERKKFAMVTEFLATAGASREELALEVEANDLAARKRQAERDALQREQLEQHRFNTAEQLAVTAQRRAEVDAERHQRAASLVAELEEQEAHVQQVMGMKEGERKLRIELSRQRQANISQNLERLDRTFAYRYRMRKLQVDREQQQMALQAQAKHGMAHSMTLSRIKMARDRETLLEQVAKLSAGPALLRITASSKSDEQPQQSSAVDGTTPSRPQTSSRMAIRQGIVQKLQQSLENQKKFGNRPGTSPAGRGAITNGDNSNQRLAIADRPSSSPQHRSSASAAPVSSAATPSSDRTTPITLITSQLRSASQNV